MKARFFIFLLCFARYLRCGLLSNAVQRIINGINTNIKLVPYMVSIEEDNKHTCGAAIIYKKWLVTAAHCLTDVDPFKQFTLYSGCSNRNENCAVHNVANFFIHEKFNQKTLDYDIAVIQVTPAFTYNDRTKAVDLPAPNGDVHGEWGTVCGWGYYKKSNDIVDKVLSKNLRCAEVPRIGKKECDKYYYGLTLRMTCYGFEKGGTDACQGDSGGPIVNVDNILLGITSWGYDCAKWHAPGVYTDVTLLQDWIREKTGMNN